jgi:hypothetical protein
MPEPTFEEMAPIAQELGYTLTSECFDEIAIMMEQEGDPSPNQVEGIANCLGA